MADILGNEGKKVVYLQSKNSGDECASGGQDIGTWKAITDKSVSFTGFFPLQVTKHTMLRLYLANKKTTHNVLMLAPA